METQVRRGRPNKGLNKLMQVMVTEADWKAVKAYADAVGETPSEVVRYELRRLIDKVNAIQKAA